MDLFNRNSKPQTGVLFGGNSGNAMLVIEIPGDTINDQYFIVDGPSTATGYMRSGDNTIAFRLSSGSYRIKSASGKGWKGERDLFETDCIKSSTDVFQIEAGSAAKITLQRVSGGNLGSHAGW